MLLPNLGIPHHTTPHHAMPHNTMPYHTTPCCFLTLVCCSLTEQLLSVGWYERVLHPTLYPIYESQWTKRMSNRASVGGGINKSVENANQQVNRKAKRGVTDFR
jgi:hypothetical protein